MKKFNCNDCIWFYDDLYVYQGRVERVVDNVKEPYYIVKVISMDGKTSIFGGTQGCSFDKAFSTRKEALRVMETEHKKQVEDYCNQINTVEDLISFMLNHTVCGDEEIDYRAREASIACAKKFGFNIKEN